MDLDSSTRRLAELFEWHVAPSMPEDGAVLVVYGAGSCGRDAVHALLGCGYKVAAFLDANASKIGSVDGIPCYVPGSQEAAALAAGGVPALIAVFNFTADTGEIENSLRNGGFQTILPYYALDAKFPGRLKSRFWLASRKYWESHREDILIALKLWEDGLSRKTFLDLVELRLTSNLQLLRAPDLGHQYFPEDIPAVRDPVRLIDGGAFVGDTLAAMRRFGMEAVAAFEPDIENFRGLRRRLDENAGELEEVVLFPCGLGSETAMCRFQQGQAAGSAISESGDAMIQVVALDDVLPRFAPTFIKLDIEGAEIAALHGASKMIQKHQPRVAACVYHLPAHLWEVPILLRELLPSHRLFLRYHGFNGFDAVAYAVEP